MENFYSIILGMENVKALPQALKGLFAYSHRCFCASLSFASKAGLCETLTLILCRDTSRIVSGVVLLPPAAP